MVHVAREHARVGVAGDVCDLLGAQRGQLEQAARRFVPQVVEAKVGGVDARTRATERRLR